MSEKAPHSSENNDFVPNFRLDIIDADLEKIFNEGLKDNRLLENVYMDQVDLIDREVAKLMDEALDAVASHDATLMSAIQELTERSSMLKKRINESKPGHYTIH